MGNEQGTDLKVNIHGFEKGQSVSVFSVTAKRWIRDGSIVDILIAPGTHQGYQLPAGAIKGRYSKGKRDKWIYPNEARALILGPYCSRSACRNACEDQQGTEDVV